jgi:hypothetical protein
MGLRRGCQNVWLVELRSVAEVADRYLWGKTPSFGAMWSRDPGRLLDTCSVGQYKNGRFLHSLHLKSSPTRRPQPQELPQPQDGKQRPQTSHF